MKRYLVIAFLLVTQAPALADSPDLTLQLGSLGIGAGVVMPSDPRTQWRLQYNYFQYSRSDIFQNLVIDVTARLRLDQQYRLNNGALLFDKYPLAVLPFHLTGGIFYNNNAIHGVSVPIDSSITINGVVYPQNVAGNIILDASWRRLAPYVGIGWANKNSKRGWSLAGDLGVVYQGKVTVGLTSTGAIQQNQATFQKYFDEETRQLTSQLGPLQFYPLGQLTFRLRL